MQAPQHNIAPPEYWQLQTTMDALGYDDTLSWAAQTTSGPDTNLAHYPRLMYYYHPDYLGHVEYITDLDGVPYQYFYYTPWGEALVEQKNVLPGMSYNSPYRFNSKELDEEPTERSSRTPSKNKTSREQTGLYYYGARYYNPTVSVWLGVDPLAEKYPSLSSYVFTGNNPVIFVDPDGKAFVTPKDYETAARARSLVNNVIKEYEKDNASFSKKIDKINANKIWSAEKKASKIRDFQQLIKTNEIHIEILNDVVKGIDEMETSDIEFTFKGSNLNPNFISVNENGIVTIPFGNDANLIHEIVHGVQIASGRIGIEGKQLVFYPPNGLSPLGAEVEAYKAQFSFDRNSMPSTKAGAFDSLESITPNSVKSIFILESLPFNKYREHYPYENIIDW
jgi:RHS repeat-associated protein